MRLSHISKEGNGYTGYMARATSIGKMMVFYKNNLSSNSVKGAVKWKESVKKRSLCSVKEMKLRKWNNQFSNASESIDVLFLLISCHLD